MADERDAYFKERETDLGNPMDPLRHFVRELIGAIDRGAVVPVEEVKRAVEEDRLDQLLGGLPQGNPLDGVEETARTWIVEGITCAAQLAGGPRAVPFRNGLLWLLDLAVEMLYQGEMP